MLTSHDFQDRLVIEKSTGGSVELVAQWGNTPKGWELLTRQMIAMQEMASPSVSYKVRQAQPTDNLQSVPSILRQLKTH